MFLLIFSSWIGLWMIFIFLKDPFLTGTLWSIKDGFGTTKMIDVFAGGIVFIAISIKCLYFLFSRNQN